MIFLAFPSATDVYEPLIWVLSALTMTVGNLIALRQTNIVRMLAYSSVSQGGFILMPLAFAGNPAASESAMKAVVIYLLVYGFTNLGAFAVVIAVSRKTRSGEISSFGGLIDYAPGLAVLMTLFLASLAGIPPLGGWIAKFNAFKAVLDAGTNAAYVLAVIGAVNTAIAAAYYLRVIRVMWMDEAPDGDETPIVTPPAVTAGPRHHGGRHDRSRRAARTRHALRRSPRPHRRRARPVTGAAGAALELRDAISDAGGAIPFSRFMEIALYGESGFYGRGGRAGRRGDFLTSPEVGPLFGAVLARFLDAEWERLGRPDPFTVVDAGAGPGTLARTVLAARPACLAGLRYVAVERSGEQRRQHPDGIESRADLPDGPFDGVVVANELLDNLPFGLAVNDGRWREAFVATGPGDTFVEVLSAPFDPRPAVLPAQAPLGARAPLQHAARDWVSSAHAVLRRGRLVVVDYARPTTAELVGRPWRDWLRTYRRHDRGVHYLAAPGDQDITTDVAIDQLPPADAVRTQAQFLQAWGIDELVADGARAWERAAAQPDRNALMMRSRTREREALIDPSGLGAFTVMEWVAR